MSENITHTGICDDTRRLIFAASEHESDLLPPAFLEAVDKHQDIMRLGGVTRHADQHSVELLDDLRQRQDKLDDQDLRRLAFIIGWLSHRAADRQMKPIFRATCPNSELKPTECSVYHDAFIYRHRYHGQSDLYIPEQFELMSEHAELGKQFAGLKSIVRHLLQGSLIGIHTLIPDDKHPKEWIDQLTRSHQIWRIDMDRYLNAIVNPDDEKVQEYIIDTNFYDSNDTLITYVESLQAEDTSAQHSCLHFAGEQSSHYAQALDKSWEFIKATGRHWMNKISNDELAGALEHGQKLRDGIGG